MTRPAAAVGATPGRGHRPALDGLRALSVVAIMLFHAAVPGVRGGYWSVNVFFVVSGYLITTLLLREHDRWGSIDLIGFYRRRARRLLPALLLLVGVVCLLAPRLMGERTPAGLRGDGVAALLYVANWRMVLTGQSYFEELGSPSPLRHLWTLAIEEQFYLLFPLVLMVLLRLAGRRRWVPVAGVAALALASAVAMAALHTGGDPSRVYYGTDTRVQDVLAGCLVALVLSRIGPRRVADLAGTGRVWGAVAGMLLLVLGALVVAVPARGRAFEGGYLAVDAVIALLVLAVELAPRSAPARLLGARPAVRVGRLSYALYLWHWPVYVVLDPQRTGLTGPALLAVRLVVSVALAVASYRLVEDPVRRGALTRLGRRRARAVVAAGLAACAAAVAASTAGVATAPTVRAGDVSRTTVGSGGTRVLVVGDSVGFSLGYSFPADELPGYTVSTAVSFGCGTAEQHLAVDGRPQGPTRQVECDRVFPGWAQAARSTRPRVVLWSLGGWEVFDHVRRGRVLTVGSAQYRDYLLGRLEQGLTALGPGPRAVLITQVPCYRQPSFVVAGQDLAPVRNDPARGRAVNEILRAFAQRHPGRVRLVDTGSLLCPGGTFHEEVDGVRMRIDGVHYSADGAHRFWRWLRPTLDRVAR